MAQLAVSIGGAVLGGVAGFFMGGPAGAAWGAQLGFMAGGIAGSLLIHQPGPQPADLRVQDSAYGKPIPTVYGVYRVSGNVIWAGQPHSHNSGGGKGTPQPNQTTVTMSFAVGLCRGPIKGIRRIWANGKLIYDVSNPSNFQQISGSNQMVTNFAMYPGDENQNPDPIIQAAEGVANTPPFRGLAYVVFNELDLSKWGNYLPSLSFEVVASAVTTWTKSGSTTTRGTPALPGGATSNVGTYIDAAGNVYGYTMGIVGIYFAIQPWQQSIYGTTYSLPNVIPTGWGAVINSCQSYDEPGIMLTSGLWYNNDGVATQTGINIGLAASSDSSAIKKNNRWYVAGWYGNGKYPIYTSNGGFESAGDTAASWKLMGVSGSYIYAIGIDSYDANYGCWLCQFDLYGNLVRKLWYSTQLSLICVGWCVSDTELYIMGMGGSYQTIQKWNGAAMVDTGIPNDTSGNCSTFRIQNGNVYYSDYAFGPTFYALVPTLSATPEPLSAIVSDICTNAGLLPSQFDVSTLTDSVTGYAVTNHSTPRGDLTPLMATYFFDANDTDNVLRLVKRGSAPVGSIAFNDLGSSATVGDSTNETPITEIIAQEMDLPRSLSFTYSAQNADYQVNTQRAFKASTRSNRDATMQAPVVLSDDEALMRAQSMLWQAWVGRKTFQFSTTLAYIMYEPGDVVTLNGASGNQYTVRITRVIYDGQGNLNWEAQAEEPDIYPDSTYNAQGGAPSGFQPQQLDYSGPTVLAVLDIPPLRDYDAGPGLYMAACGMASNWPGAIVDISRDGSSFTQLQRILNGAAIGYATTALQNFMGGNQPDELSAVTVTLYSGTLSSIGYTSFLQGVNAAYLGGEIIFFRNATPTGANTWVLSGLLRGRVGTEWAMPSHAAGEQFVFLDPAVMIRPTVNVSDIGSTMYFEPHLLNLFINQPVNRVTAHPLNAGVKPLSPVLFRAGRGSSSSTSDLTLSWIRRARVNGYWVSGADVPLDQSAESYALTIMNASGTTVRSITVSAAQSWIYTSANMTADGFAAGSTIKFSIAQNSDQGVPGYAATTSFVR